MCLSPFSTVLELGLGSLLPAASGSELTERSVFLIRPHTLTHSRRSPHSDKQLAGEREREWHLSIMHKLCLFWEYLSEHLLLWAFLTLLYGIQFQLLNLPGADYKTHWWKQPLDERYPCVHNVIGFESNPSVTTMCINCVYCFILDPNASHKVTTCNPPIQNLKEQWSKKWMYFLTLLRKDVCFQIFFVLYSQNPID